MDSGKLSVKIKINSTISILCSEKISLSLSRKYAENQKGNFTTSKYKNQIKMLSLV